MGVGPIKTIERIADEKVSVFFGQIKHSQEKKLNSRLIENEWLEGKPLDLIQELNMENG